MKTYIKLLIAFLINLFINFDISNILYTGINYKQIFIKVNQNKLIEFLIKIGIDFYRIGKGFQKIFIKLSIEFGESIFKWCTFKQ